MFYDRSLSKLKVFKLDKCISHHNFVKYGTKKAKLEAIKVNIIQQLLDALKKRNIGKAKRNLTVSQKKTVSLQR